MRRTGGTNSVATVDRVPKIRAFLSLTAKYWVGQRYMSSVKPTRPILCAESSPEWQHSMFLFFEAVMFSSSIRYISTAILTSALLLMLIYLSTNITITALTSVVSCLWCESVGNF